MKLKNHVFSRPRQWRVGAGCGHIARCRRTARYRGASSTEYILILGLVVIPIGALLGLFLWMIKTYGERCISLMALPFP